VGNSGVILEESGKAAIKCTTSLLIEEWEAVPMRGIAYAKIRGIHFYTCYAPPSDSPEQFEDMLVKLVNRAD